MLRTYRAVLTTPGAPAFSAAGALARLPLSMLGIGLVLLIESTTNSYGTAGAVAGVFGLSSAFASPLLSRAIDRFGQAKVMLPALGVHVAGLGLILVLALGEEPVWTIFAAALLAGCTSGSMGSLVRARWAFVLKGHEQESTRMHTAYSLESVIDEMVFISGPLLVTLLAVQFGPTYGILTAIVAVGVGGSLLLIQRRTEPPPSDVPLGPGAGVMRSPGMVVICLAMICIGVIFGSIEVLTVAYADELDQLGQAGVVLAFFAFGSLLAGLWYGSVQWRAGTGRRFRFGLVLLAVGVLPLVLVQNLWQLGLVVFLAGFGISPTLISGNSMVQELVEPSRLTEGLTWTNSGIGIGVAAGAALSGAAVDAIGAQRGLIVPAAAGLIAAVLVLTCSRWLRPVVPTVDLPAPDSRADQPAA